MARFEENLTDLVEHRGPFFLAHRRACVAAFGGVLLDDLEALVEDGDHAG